MECCEGSVPWRADARVLFPFHPVHLAQGPEARPGCCLQPPRGGEHLHRLPSSPADAAVRPDPWWFPGGASCNLHAPACPAVRLRRQAMDHRDGVSTENLECLQTHCSHEQ